VGNSTGNERERGQTEVSYLGTDGRERERERDMAGSFTSAHSVWFSSFTDVSGENPKIVSICIKVDTK
jgi:hypothetical protein